MEPRRKESTFHDSFTQVAYNGLMFREKIMEHAEWVAEMLQTHPGIANSEAQTKTTLIEPLLQCLGYVPRDPEQVTLEVPTELGGKIDYVLTGEANTKIAVEAKKAGAKLSEKEINQLRSYFTFSEAVGGVLTNGVDYWLFTDLDKTNVMDAAPYHRVDVKHLTDNDIHHLETLTRNHIQQSAVHEQARRERYRKLVNEIVDQELDSPSQELLKLIGKKAGIKPLTQPNMKMLEPLVEEAMDKYRGVVPSPAPSQPIIDPPFPKPVVSKPEIKTSGQGRRPPLQLEKCILFGRELQVKTFKAMFTEVVTEMIQCQHPHKVAEVVRGSAFKGRKWWMISTNESDLSPNLDKAQIGTYWVNVHFSAKEYIAHARKYLREFGYDPEELVVHISED